MGRQIERSTGSRLVDGSFRPSIHKLDASAPKAATKAKSWEIPASITRPGLRRLWEASLAELEERETLVAEDLVVLEAAFTQLEIAGLLEAQLLAFLSSPSIEPGIVAKLQTALVSATSSAARVLARFGIASPLDRAKGRAAAPKPTQGGKFKMYDPDEWEGPDSPLPPGYKPKRTMKEILDDHNSKTHPAKGAPHA